MKQIILLLTITLLSLGSNAQIKFEDITIKEAVTKAKREGKIVMLIGSTTW